MRRRWWAVVALAALGALVAALPSPPDTVDSVTTWQASHTLLLSNTSATQTIYSDPVTFNQLQLFATVGEVPKRAAEKLGFGGEPAALAGQVSVDVNQSTGALRITTRQPTADEATSIADTFAAELTTYLSERQDSLQSLRLAAALEEVTRLEGELAPLQRQVASNPDDAILRARLDALTREYSVAYEQYRSLQVDRGQLQLTTLEFAQAIAITDRGLAAPRSRTSRGMLGGTVGAVAGVGLAVLLARADRRLRTRAQAEAAFGLRCQVAVPSSHERSNTLVVRPDRHEPLSDAYRTLRSVIGFVEAGAAQRAGHVPVVVVVSAGSGDGKTTVTGNLAAAYVESGTPAVAVNADFRRPALSQHLAGRRPEQMAFSASELALIPVATLLSNTNVPGLKILDLAGNQAAPGDLARITTGLLPQLNASPAGVILVDTSPVGATAEVLEFLPLADVVVIVGRLDHTRIEGARRTIDTVRAITRVEPLLVLIGEKAAHQDYYEYAGRLDDKGRRPAKLKD